LVLVLHALQGKHTKIQLFLTQVDEQGHAMPTDLFFPISSPHSHSNLTDEKEESNERKKTRRFPR
jgi:hypothetical protein